MRLQVVTIILLVIGLSCNVSQEDKTIKEAAQAYYQALNKQDAERFFELHLDSVRIKEGDYASVISFSDYKAWLEWDAVFDPVYILMDVKHAGDQVEVTVSKKCKRIQFLNQEPVINKEVLTFKDGKIVSLEVTASTSFNEAWVARRERLVAWVDLHHPELSGFIHDQTEAGGLKYLRALELYEGSEEFRALITN